MWRYIFLTRKIALKNAKKERNQYTYANCFWPIVKETWKTAVALCGANFCTSKNGEKNTKNDRKQYICQLFVADFQGNMENLSGAMWRYFSAPRKTAKKKPRMKGNNIHMSNTNFFGPIFNQTWKTLVALCGAILYLEKRLKKHQITGNNTYANFFVPIFKETWKTLVALCGAIFLHLEKRLKNTKNEGKL